MKYVKAIGIALCGLGMLAGTAWAGEPIEDAWYGDGGASSPYALVTRENEPGFSYTPSPEQWRDRNIYQLFTDRFAFDGNNHVRGYRDAWDCEYTGDGNNRQFPLNRNYHHAGNWKGLQNQIPYLKDLGVTAVWISGVQQNDQGVNDNRWSPYHQYHVDNFFRCDPCMGTFQDLKELIDALHTNNIAVILDVAPNHMSDKCGYGSVNDDKQFHWDEGGRHWWFENNTHCAPFNNLDRFHVNGTINNWDQSPENLMGQFKGTDDLKQEDEWTSKYLYMAFKNLIDATDCDGFRVDAIKHIPYDWCMSWAQAMRDHAAYRGKKNFLMFGELFSYDHGALASWCKDGYGFNSALLFPLMQAMNNAFGYGYSTYQLGEEMNRIQQYGQGKDNVIAFLDNHDVNRFAQQFGGGSVDNAVNVMKPAMTFLYLAPPVPLLYYGTEHAFNQGGHGNGTDRNGNEYDYWYNPDDSDWQRECMFDRGFQPGNARGDMFANWEADHNTRLCGHIRWLNGLRNKFRSLRRGGFEMRKTSGGQGVSAFTKWYDQEVSLVVFNTSDYEQPFGDWPNVGLKNTAFYPDGDTNATPRWSNDQGYLDMSGVIVTGKCSLVYICNPVDNSADVFGEGGGGGGGGGDENLWVKNTYGWPTTDATLADKIYVNTEAGPAENVDDVVIFYAVNPDETTGDWPPTNMVENAEWYSEKGKWWHLEIPASDLAVGELQYCIRVRHGTNEVWDNNGGGNYRLKIGPAPVDMGVKFQGVSATPAEPADGGEVAITAALVYAPTTTVGTLTCALKYDFEGTSWKTVQMEKTSVATNAASVVTNAAGVVTNPATMVSYYTYTLKDLPGGQTLNYWVEATMADVGSIKSDNDGNNYSVRVKMSAKGIAWHCPTNHMVAGIQNMDTNWCMRWKVTPKAGESVDLYFGNYQGGDSTQTTDIDNNNEPMDMKGGTLYYQFVNQVIDHSQWSANWQTASLNWTNRNVHDNYWKGTVQIPAAQKGNYLVYYFKSYYTNDTTPVNKVGLEDTYVYMDPDDSAMYKRALTEAEAQASPFEVAIAGEDDAEPGFIWHGGDIIRAGADDKVRIQVKIGYQKTDGTKLADEVIVRYRIDSDAAGVARSAGVKAVRKNAKAAKSWPALPLQTNMTFQGTVADANPVGDAMMWAVTIQDDRLLDDRAVLVYEIYARRTTASGGNGQWKQAEYNAGNGSCTFFYRMWSDGSGDLTVDGVPADYTTSKFFIDESKGESVTVKVAYHAPDDADAVEVFSNFGRRDYADVDTDNDGWPDGMIPPDGNSITADNCADGYWQAIRMKKRQGAWEADLTTDKCGVYRITARYKAAGASKWTWYSENPDGAARRDHVVVISPKKAMQQTMYELNVLTTKATDTTAAACGTFEGLSKRMRPEVVAGNDNYGEFSIDYLNRMGINCLWFQPIHPNLDYARGNTDGNGDQYHPGSPYATKNYFGVNTNMSDLKTAAGAMKAFQDFVGYCDRAKYADGETKNLETINVMLDGVLNHTSFDAVFGEGWTMATNGLGSEAIKKLDADPNFGTNAPSTNYWRNIQPTDTIPNTALGIRWYSHKVENGMNHTNPATYWNSVDDNDIDTAPERYDFGKWNDVAELLYGHYSTMVRWNDMVEHKWWDDEGEHTYTEMGEETGRVYSEEDQYYYTEMQLATKLLWKYMATYPEFWIKKTGNDGTNHWDATDDLGIDGLRCDYAQGLPNQFWEYTVNRTRHMKWNFLFMAESLDGGKVGFRSNRQFDILNENMVFRFTQDHVSDPAKFQRELEDRRQAYGNGLILLNLTCHDEVMPWGDAQATASRYAMVSAIDGVPMIFYGQEQAICKFEQGIGLDGKWHDDNPDAADEYKGFAKFEQNFGKWIPHFKTWNKMHVWTNPPCKAGEANDSRAMAEFYGRINLARQQSPALQSRNRWFLNDTNKIMFVAKWEEEGALQKGKDAVFAAVLFLNDNMEGDHNGHWGAGCTYDISPFAAKMGIQNRSDRLYNLVNIASTSTNFLWAEPKSGAELYANGLEITGMDGSWVWDGEQKDRPATEWTDNGLVVQYLRVVDVSGFVPQDGLVILDPDESPLTVDVGTANYAVSGTAGANVTGPIYWTNALNGANGSFEKSDAWTNQVPLATGGNVITFSAATSGTTVTTVAEDKAADYQSWANGSTGGTGFGAWALEAAANSGHFIASTGENPSLSIGSKAFGMYANSGATAGASRSLNQALAVGDSFSLSFENGDISMPENENITGGVGFALLNASSNTLWQLFFNGGENNYKHGAGNGEDTGVGFTYDGLDVTFTLTSATSYKATIKPRGGTAKTVTGTLPSPEGGQSIAKVRFWNWNAGNGDGCNVYFDNLKVTSTASAPGETAMATVTIVVPAEEPSSEIEIAGQPEIVVDPVTGKISVKVACCDAASSSFIAAGTTLPVYTATKIVNGDWNWTLKGSVVVGENGEAVVPDLPATQTGVLLLCIGTPPGM
jgi:glycosidase